MLKASGRLATWKVEGYVIQEVQRGIEILVTSSDFEDLVGTKICLLHSNIEKIEEEPEVAVTTEEMGNKAVQ